MYNKQTKHVHPILIPLLSVGKHATGAIHRENMPPNCAVSSKCRKTCISHQVDFPKSPLLLILGSGSRPMCSAVAHPLCLLTLFTPSHALHSFLFFLGGGG